MGKDEMVGSQTLISVTRLGDGSTTGWYVGTPMGLGRIKNNEIICKLSGSIITGSPPALCTLYGGIAGSPIAGFAQQPAELIGSMYLGTASGAPRERVKLFDTGGALFLRARVANRVSGTPLGVVKFVVGRVIARE